VYHLVHPAPEVEVARLDATSERTTLTVPEAARLLGLGLSKFSDMVVSGQVPSIKAGRRRLIPKDALDQWVRDEIERARAEGERAAPAARRRR